MAQKRHDSPIYLNMIHRLSVQILYKVLLSLNLFLFFIK